MNGLGAHALQRDLPRGKEVAPRAVVVVLEDDGAAGGRRVERVCNPSQVTGSAAEAGPAAISAPATATESVVSFRAMEPTLYGFRLHDQ